MPALLLTCLGSLVALGLAEQWAARRARAAVPVRVHVNGTRGKSTVTRLVAAALREAGVPTVAKVTGTDPRLIDVDGAEQPIRRAGPANIREQAWLLREAKRRGARAVVAECMAVRPDLQWVAEREMVRATIGVITNARLDHVEVMGRTGEDIARSLANTVPRGAVLVVGDPRFTAIFAARCASLGTRMVVAGVGPRTSDVGRLPGASWFDEDVAIALAVTRELGIGDDVAIAAFRNAAFDPGAVSGSSVTFGVQDVAWIDATAANDPESLDSLVSATQQTRPGVVIYNHRGDRPERLRAFARHSAAFRGAAAILLTGDRPALTLSAEVRRLCPGATTRFVSARGLATHIESAVLGSSAGRIVFCGNTRGWSNPLMTSGPSPRAPLTKALADGRAATSD